MIYALLSQSRHPELVSGSIGRFALPYGWQTQPHGKVAPMRVFGFDEVYFPLAMLVFELFFPRYGRRHIFEHFEMNKAVDSIFGRMPWGQIIPVLVKALYQIRCYADVQRAIMLAGQYIDAGLFLLPHRQSVADGWTLKQVQGDEIGVREANDR